MNAVIYARYSSHAQKDTSIEQQLQVCRKYADDNDLKIVGEYCDHAISGTSDKRPEFLRMIKDSAKLRWQRVLVYKVDRFARNRYDAATYKARLKMNGVKVISVMEPIPEGPEGILLEAVLEGSAEYYSANLRQNVRRGMEDNARACRYNNGWLPLGYKKGDDGRYAVDPAGAQVVREIFESYAAGKNAQQIVAELNARGICTSTGKPFHKNSLQSILRNEKYIGVYKWSDIRIEGGVPAIVSKELWEEVRERLKKVAMAPAAERTDVDYLLTGKIFCGKCGSPMTGESGAGKSGQIYRYYNCVKRKRSRGCDKKLVRKEFIEEFVVRQTMAYCLSDEMIENILDASMALQEKEKDNTMLRSFEAQLSDTKKAIANMLNAIEAGIITPSTKERLNELESRRTDLEIAIEDEKAVQPQVTREHLAFLLERFRKGDPADPKFQESFIDTFISAVYVYDDHIRIVCGYSQNSCKDFTYEFIDSIDTDPGNGIVFDFGHSLSARFGRDRLTCLSRFLMGSGSNPSAGGAGRVCDRCLRRRYDFSPQSAQ